MVIAMSDGAGRSSWIATVWARPGQVRLAVHWALGLAALLATGLYTSRPMMPAGVSLHDTYYVVAHFHYVLSLAGVFAVFAGWYYVFPKVTGRRYSEALGRLHFWLTFVGVCLTVLPMHFLALETRRFVDYPGAFAYANWWALAGSYLTAAGTLVFAAATLHACLVGRGRHG